MCLCRFSQIFASRSGDSKLRSICHDFVVGPADLRSERFQRGNAFSVEVLQCERVALLVEMERGNGAYLANIFAVEHILGSLKFALVERVDEKHLEGFDIFHGETVFLAVFLGVSMKFLDLLRLVDLVPRLRFVVLLLLLEHLLQSGIVGLAAVEWRGLVGVLVFRSTDGFFCGGRIQNNGRFGFRERKHGRCILHFRKWDLRNDIQEIKRK